VSTSGNVASNLVVSRNFWSGVLMKVAITGLASEIRQGQSSYSDAGF
jgi:hypothetical protein